MRACCGCMRASVLRLRAVRACADAWSSKSRLYVRGLRARRQGAGGAARPVRSLGFQSSV
eukprot:4515488-Pleurochrysis_carterae.AAC.1